MRLLVLERYVDEKTRRDICPKHKPCLRLEASGVFRNPCPNPGIEV